MKYKILGIIERRTYMKLLHIADLHIGKRIHERSLLEDQAYILKQIIDMVEQHKPDGILIAGDIYDKSIPLERGVSVFDDFLTALNHCHVPVFIISGNHDSGERLHFGARIMAEKEVYVTGVYKGTLEKITLNDTFGPVNIYLLPFMKPGHVREFFGQIDTYEEAVKAVIDHSDVDTAMRNVLVAHQFVTNAGIQPETCDSETITIGGSDNVDASVFRVFDYVALGHLHGAQRIGSQESCIRYAGSPLKYSFSEVNQKKSVTMITLQEKGNLTVELLPLLPFRDMRAIKGPLEELVKKEYVSQGDPTDYMRVTLTNEEELFAPLDKLRSVYPNILRLDFENSRTASNENIQLNVKDMKNKTPFHLMEEFYEKQNNQPLSQEQRKRLQDILGGEKQ